jgi:sigma-B regulation protein RsbU (phosphoserine phosphatase)
MGERTLRLLVVDDNPHDVDLVRAQLADAARDVSFAVESVGRLGAALERLARKDVDVVLLDLGLPDAAGTQGVVRLAREATEIPVVVLTGHDNEALGLRAVQDGAQDYLVKGQVSGPVLQRSLRYAIERKRAEQALARLAVVMGALCFECGRKVSGDPGTRRYQH